MRREKTAEQQEEVRTRQEGKTTTELLRQACRDANASVDVGNDTNTKLSKQGEQMTSMSNTLENIEYELKVSDRIMKGMSSWGGMVSSWFTSAPKAPKEKKEEIRKSEKRPKRQDEKHRPIENLNRTHSPIAQGHDEDDQLLDALHNDLKIMKTQATTQREVIKEQNTKLDELVKKSEAVTQHMRSTDRKVRQML
jgi:hypothetical protein